jgi:predicted nucleic acid-binding protein
MPLLVSDANIFIDLEEGGLIDSAFALPERIEVPDLLFADELAQDHGDLLERGLEVSALGQAGIEDLLALTARHGRISRYDCAALALAREHACTLLTGDAYLRDAAEREGIPVHGTIWLVERMLDEHLLDTTQAREGFDRMQEAGRRLPWDLAEAMLRARES